MIEATYQCNSCRRDHKSRFVVDFPLLRGWLFACPFCQKYGLQKLVGIKDSEGKVIPLRRWGTVCR